jgi:hypothetical protein
MYSGALVPGWEWAACASVVCGWHPGAIDGAAVLVLSWAFERTGEWVCQAMTGSWGPQPPVGHRCATAQSCQRWCDGALLIQLELCASRIHCKPELGQARDSVYEWSTKKAHACAWHERSHQQAHRHTSAPTQTYLLFKIFTLASCGNDLVGVTRCQVPAESRAREAP